MDRGRTTGGSEFLVAKAAGAHPMAQSACKLRCAARGSDRRYAHARPRIRFDSHTVFPGRARNGGAGIPYAYR